MNQNDLNEKLVSQEVYVCLTPMVEFVLTSASDDKDNWEPPFSYDDIENSYNKECSRCGKDESEHNNYCCADGESFEAEPQEILEWWAVSPWLYEKLKEEGEPVIDTFPHLWGRTTSGQQISADSVISTIQKKTSYGEWFDGGIRNMKTINIEPLEEGVLVATLQSAYARTESDGRAEVIKGLLAKLGWETE